MDTRMAQVHPFLCPRPWNVSLQLFPSKGSVSYPLIWGWSCDLLWLADCSRRVLWPFWASASEHLHITTSSIETLPSCHVKEFRPSSRRLEAMFSSHLSCPRQHPFTPQKQSCLLAYNSSNANKLSQGQKNRSAEPNQNCTHRLVNEINGWYGWYFKLKICAVGC